MNIHFQDSHKETRSRQEIKITWLEGNKVEMKPYRERKREKAKKER